MQIGVLGTGIFGQAIGTKLVKMGNKVVMGSRTPDSKTAHEWAKSNGKNASPGTFEDAAKSGEVIFLTTKGSATIDAIKMAKHEHFK